ncbi:MAG TPA: proteasome subunit alpha [Nitrospiria bacterium]|nr:proteasome subunit alpha [Nitrospiria bacterium]
MAFPYYVSPEQMMQDKAEYAKKGIAKGRSIIAVEYQDGILIVADNPSTSLNKISEIYDNIAFLGAGKYSEFENLRKAGIRHADLKGYMYSREDVTAKSLANAYSQALGTTFSQEVKPLEVEIAVVAVGEGGQSGEIYRISFDGTITDERGFTVIGGRSEAITLFLKDRYKVGVSLSDTLKLCTEAMESTTGQRLAVQNLEVAVLDRNRQGRKFRRLTTDEITELIHPR